MSTLVGGRAIDDSVDMTVKELSIEQQFLPDSTWIVDGPASTVRFSVKHLMVATVHGRFGAVTGSISADGDRIAATGSVDVATIDTGDAKRDEHLRGPGFFDADRNPVIEFRSTSSRARPDGTWSVTGDLTIGDITQPVTFDAVVGEGPVIYATGSLSRRAHGLDWPALRQAGRAVVGDRVSIDLEIVLR